MVNDELGIMDCRLSTFRIQYSAFILSWKASYALLCCFDNNCFTLIGKDLSRNRIHRVLSILMNHNFCMTNAIANASVQ